MYSFQKSVGIYLLFLFLVIIGIPVTHGASTDGENNAVSFTPLLSYLLSQSNRVEGLSESQNILVGILGYPQQFTKMFSYEDGKKRVDEIWVYSEYRLTESFINGVFIGESSFSGSYGQIKPSLYKPQDFKHGTTIQNIISAHGQPLSTKDGNTWNGKTTTYLYRFFYVTFNNANLISITALK
jgi:hypothetical protein